MSEIQKIQLEADYKKSETKIDTRTTKLEKKDEIKESFKTSLEKSLKEDKLGPSDLCQTLKANIEKLKKTETSDTEKAKLTEEINTSIQKINTSLQTTFDIVPFADQDNKDLIGFKMDDSDKEYRLIGKDDFFSLFTEMVTELYKEAGDLTVDKELKENKDKEFTLSEEVIIWGKKGSEIGVKKEETSPPENPTSPTKTWETMSIWEKFTSQPGKLLEDWLNRFKSLPEKFNEITSKMKELNPKKTFSDIWSSIRDSRTSLTSAFSSKKETPPTT